jgi:hypothetical protein
MSERVQAWRLGLFCVVCAALAWAAVAFAGGGSPPSPPTPPPASSAAQVAVSFPQRAQAHRAALVVAARRFLSAFFRYEVGETGPSVRSALRANATPAFAAELLRSPVRVPAQRPQVAKLGALTVDAASISPPRVLVSGTAIRGGLPEGFSFLFESRGGVWLASGAGE